MALIVHVAVTLVVVAAILGSLAIWVSVLARSRRGVDLVPLEARRPVPWTLLDLLLIIIAHLLFAGLGSLLLREVWNMRLPADIREIDPRHLGAAQLNYIAATLLTIAFAIALFRLRVGATWADVGFLPRRFLYDLKLGASAFVTLAAPIYALQALLVYFFPVQHPLIDLVQARPDPWMFLIVGVSVSLVAPLSEEFFLRVIFQGWLERLAAIAVPESFPGHSQESPPPAGEDDEPAQNVAPNDPYATPRGPRSLADQHVDGRTARALTIVISALVFALLHVGQGPAPIPLFLLALGLGYLYQRTHRIWPAVVLHFLLNTSSLVMLWLTAE